MNRNYQEKKPKKYNTPQIKFKNQHLEFIREKLLKDLTTEYYACLLCKKEIIDNDIIIKVLDARFPTIKDRKSSSIVSIVIDGGFTENILNEINDRLDVDTLIELHTHPFSKEVAHFSSQDDEDEKTLSKTISKYFPFISYGSIVFSQTEYFARMWKLDNIFFNPSIIAKINTQLYQENIHHSGLYSQLGLVDEEYFKIYNRGMLALGKNNLSNIMKNQIITLVGVGGIGSIVAENLVHMGFLNINLIDHDICEVSNLNRVAGLYYDDAINKELKVDVIKKHLKRINPKVNVQSFASKIDDAKLETVIANSSWVILGTDNHSSRYQTQLLCFKYFVPFISTGVNITVVDGKVMDISGEVITIRMGDNVCLTCLNKLSPNEIAKELSTDPNVVKGLVSKGYVKGADVKEPAVKTLNSILSAMTVDILVNQYTELNDFNTIIVYENNGIAKILIDDETICKQSRICNVCGL